VTLGWGHSHNTSRANSLRSYATLKEHKFAERSKVLYPSDKERKSKGHLCGGNTRLGEQKLEVKVLNVRKKKRVSCERENNSNASMGKHWPFGDRDPPTS